MEKKETDKNPLIFDFYTRIKEIISEYESDLDKLDENQINDDNNENDIKDNPELDKIVSITLKKLIFAISCELSSYFMDNVFLISKIKFQNFSDNKSFSKVIEDILYQIVKQINIFSFKAIINIFETMRLGNFEKNSLVFFFKILLTFYFVHIRSIINLPERVTKGQYEVIFKKNYEKGFRDMKSMISLIPLVELIENEDENLIWSIMRLEDIPDNYQERPSTSSTSASLPPIKTNRGKAISVIDGINVPIPFKNEDNKLNNSMTENFFQTQLKK